MTSGAPADLHKRFTKLRSAQKEQKRQETVLAGKRNACRQSLRKRLRGTFQELHLLMSADDPRWSSFGLKAPAVRAAELTAGSRAGLFG